MGRDEIRGPLKTPAWEAMDYLQSTVLDFMSLKISQTFERATHRDQVRR